MKKIIIPFIIGLIIFSCSSSDESPSYDVKQLQSDLINTLEKNYTTNLTEAITLLDEKVSLFVIDTNLENLNQVKTAWKAASNAYSKAEIFNIGEISQSNIYTAFYSWNANETAINDYINSSSEISTNTINNLPTNNRGLAAIEYLIFEEDENTTLTSFTNARRLAYLQTLTKNLLEKNEFLENRWNNYRNSFITNDATGINGSINLIINQMNALLEDVKRFKIGEPGGFEGTNTSNHIKLQAEKSSTSLTLITNNIEGIKEVYFGKDNGIDDYVSSITNNNTLNTKVTNKFTEIENSINAINSPLHTAINTQTNEVKALYDKVNELIILLKVEVANALNVTITFTDNDGD